ncbi:uncharacterized protein M421DRAFT_273979 [Didymella exigua CBS 183.55]|uniref:Uncharacterized protein n=1 Tax=Didymella exigua CBS 183.55 TaxID=1150837 RepID=A0A6A5RBL5_9PLEO|nr:uncharacterized protein M421DRAFT_273979 [Didymella exigua CBS 183.55]KAF1924670.1 hypothetical protein M421DRAFT_273979 [Didymella exigua CBS 183.55]
MSLVWLSFEHVIRNNSDCNCAAPVVCSHPSGRMRKIISRNLPVGRAMQLDSSWVDAHQLDKRVRNRRLRPLHLRVGINTDLKSTVQHVQFESMTPSLPKSTWSWGGKAPEDLGILWALHSCWRLTHSPRSRLDNVLEDETSGQDEVSRRC